MRGTSDITSSVSQFNMGVSAQLLAYSGLPSQLVKAIGIMHSSVEDAYYITDIADIVGVSRRQLERLFKRYLNTTPSNYYLTIRLLHCKYLVEHSSQSFTDIAYATGFSSPPHFSKIYKESFGVSPTKARFEYQSVKETMALSV